MDFSTHDSTKHAPDVPDPWRRRWTAALALCLLSSGVMGSAQAQSPLPSGVVVERTAEHLLLSTRVGEPLSPAIQEALNKGVPLYFVWTAEVQSPRWYYWQDRTHSRAVRTLRLAYQALSGHWRLSWSNDSSPAGGWRNAVHQNHPTLDEAWAAVGRMLNWPVANHADLPPQGAWLTVNFAMDLSLLPRPFQIGLGNQADWVLERNYRLPVPAVGMTLESRHGQ